MQQECDRGLVPFQGGIEPSNGSLVQSAWFRNMGDGTRPPASLRAENQPYVNRADVS
jgi:hypothetical protein